MNVNRERMAVMYILENMENVFYIMFVVTNVLISINGHCQFYWNVATNSTSYRNYISDNSIAYCSNENHDYAANHLYGNIVYRSVNWTYYQTLRIAILLTQLTQGS